MLTRPQEHIIMHIHIEGRRIFRTMLLGTSKNAYGKKKTVKAMLYCELVRPMFFEVLSFMFVQIGEYQGVSHLDQYSCPQPSRFRYFRDQETPRRTGG